MEQLQNNGILELVYSMAQQNVNLLTETVRCDKSEPSEFQKQFEQQTKAAEKTTAQTPKEKVDDGTKKPVASSESAEQTLESEQVIVQQLIAAGVVNITPMDETVQPQEAAVELPAEVALEQNIVITPEANAETAPLQTVETPKQEVAQVGRESLVQAEKTPEQSVETEQKLIGITEQPKPENQPEQSETRKLDTMAKPDTAPKAVKEENFKVADAAESTQQVFEDVREIPVKVGETTGPRQAAETASVEEQVEVKLTQALEQGVGKVEIQLTPEHLGTVTVEFTRTADGTLSIVLSAENNRTGSLLEKHSGSLQDLLMAGGQERVQIEVHNAQESQQHQQQDFAEGRNGNQHHQQQEQSRRDSRDGQDFLQQLRLGLVPLEGEAS